MADATTIITKEIQELNVSTPLSFESDVETNTGQPQDSTINSPSLSLLEIEFWELSQRLEEGGGECIIHVGFNNDGTCSGMSGRTYAERMSRLQLLANEKLKCKMRVLDETVKEDCCSQQVHSSTINDAKHNNILKSTNQNLGTTCWSSWVLMRRIPDRIEDLLEIRIAVIGNVDAGKSTLLGVLTKGILDDGRGKARLGMFRHRHEIDSGRTSSIGQEILGFDEEGYSIQADFQKAAETTKRDNVEGGNLIIKLGWEEICHKSHKVITFLDLAGHEKYLKTTMFGLTGCAPDYALLIVGANSGLIGMAKEHLALAVALQVPIIVVVTKVDMCPGNVLETTLRGIQKTLKGQLCKRVPIHVKSKSDVLFTVKNFTGQRLAPIVQVSSVTGENLDLLKLLIQLLPLYRKYEAKEPAEFQITESYAVPGVGTVVAGTMLSGIIKIGQTVYLGPDSLGAFTTTIVKGIHRRKTPAHDAIAGQSASFALKKIKRSAIRYGMVLIDKERLSMTKLSNDTDMDSSLSITSGLAKPCREFEAEVLILFHSTTIGPRYQAMLHCGVVRQTVSIVSLGNESVLRTGDRARVRLRFVKNPEYIRVGMRLLFREGRTKGVGKVTALFG